MFSNPIGSDRTTPDRRIGSDRILTRRGRDGGMDPEAAGPQLDDGHADIGGHVEAKTDSWVGVGVGGCTHEGSADSESVSVS